MTGESKSLLSLVAQASDIETMLIQSGGEITPEIESLIEANEIELPEKIDNYALVMDRMQAISEFYKRKADVFLRLAKAADNVTNKCKDNLKLSMQAAGVNELAGFDVKFTLSNSNPSCVIENESAIEGAYKVTEVITRVDKKKILEDLKLGVPVKGARLEQTKSLRQYANTPKRLVAK